MPAVDSLTRFSNRVQDYVRYRPGYPPTVINCLKEFGLRDQHVIADVGSGTGLSSQLFLHNGNQVLAIEPNQEMRAAAEQLLGEHPRFRSIDAKAEATTLRDHSVDWVVAAQALHWFDVEACRREFARILRADGRVVLLWNDRRDDTPFLQEYETFVRAHATDYEAICHRNALQDGRVEALFAPHVADQRVFRNHQDFDLEGLTGRVLSSSYMPDAGHPGHGRMMADLVELHARHAVNGFVRFAYETKLFVGRVPPSLG